MRLEQVALHAECCCITADVLGEKLIYKLGVPGEHMAVNSLAVLAAVKLAGADLARAALALATAQPAKGRGVREKLAISGGELLLIDESYNANPHRSPPRWRCLPLRNPANTAAASRFWATCWNWEITDPHSMRGFSSPWTEHEWMSYTPPGLSWRIFGQGFRRTSAEPMPQLPMASVTRFWPASGQATW